MLCYGDMGDFWGKEGRLSEEICFIKVKFPPCREEEISSISCSAITITNRVYAFSFFAILFPFNF